MHAFLDLTQGHWIHLMVVMLLQTTLVADGVHRVGARGAGGNAVELTLPNSKLIDLPLKISYGLIL